MEPSGCVIIGEKLAHAECNLCNWKSEHHEMAIGGGVYPVLTRLLTHLRQEHKEESPIKIDVGGTDREEAKHE